MSRQISRRYLLLYLSVNAILACGSSRRIPRGASCPSCSQDCPEALTAQLPWNSRQEPNLKDFSINSFRNSPYSRSTQEEISQDITRDDNIPLSRNSIFLGNYRRVPQQEPTNRNYFSKNFLNNSPKSLDRQEIFSRDKPARGYPFVVPSRQVFDRSENLFFRHPRNKFSESLSENYERTKDYKEIEEDPASKVQAIVPSRQVFDRSENLFFKQPRDKYSESSSENYERTKDYKEIEEDPASKVQAIVPSRQVFDRSENVFFKHPRDEYSEYLSEDYERTKNYKEIEEDPASKVQAIVPSRQVFDRSENVFFKLPRDEYSEYLSEDYERTKNYKKIVEDPVSKAQAIMYRSDRDTRPSWKNSKDTSSVIQSERSLPKVQLRTNPRPLEKEDDEDMKDYFEDETKHFMNEEDMKEYFEDETEQDTIDTERDNDDSHVLPQNTWKDIENGELLDDLDFMRENSQEIEQSRLYSEENNKYFQDEKNEDVIFQDKAYTTAARAPVINSYNAYILPRYLNIVSDKKYPAKSEIQGLLEAKNNIRVNPIKEIYQRFSGDEAVIENNTRIQDLILPKNIFDVEEYSSSIADDQNNIRNKNEAVTELDPDLLDDIEDPLVATTDLTPSTPM